MLTGTFIIFTIFAIWRKGFRSHVRVLGWVANESVLLWQVMLPAALPQILTSLQVSLPLFIVAVGFIA